MKIISNCISTLVVIAWIIILASMLSGCLMARTIHSLRAEQAIEAAEFDTGCSNITIVSRQGNRRFKLAGCGRSWIYICQQDPTATQYRSAGVNYTAQADCRRLGL